MRTTTRNKGIETELACCDYLVAQGLTLIEKNVSCRFGEIDLIMRHQSTVVFIEVRFRKNDNFGGALASITPKKQQKVMLSAQTYIQKHSITSDVRIDFVAMTDNSQSESGFNFDWIQNAF